MEKTFISVIYLILTLLTLVTLYPVVYVLFASVSDSTLLLQNSGLLLRPLGFQFGAFNMVFKHPLILRSYGNTLFVVIVSLLINMLLTCLAAYVLSRKKFRYKAQFMVFIIFTMYFSGGLIPNYINIRSLGLLDSYWALILPTAINSFNLIILRNNFESLPDSLIEAAEIDGANDYHILFIIIIPLSKAVLAVITLYYMVGHWNSWFSAMIYIQDRAKFPLQLVLREILLIGDTSNVVTDIGDSSAARESVKYATIVIAIVPILCVYPFLQKYFAKGTLIGSVKG
jgi:putative aldouronate transport system permease protein